MDIKKDNRFKYKLIKKVGVISRNQAGWTKKVNIVSYNDKKSVIDIRIWSPNNKMSRGITIDKKDLKTLIKLLKKVEKKENL